MMYRITATLTPKGVKSKGYQLPDGMEVGEDCDVTETAKHNNPDLILLTLKHYLLQIDDGLVSHITIDTYENDL